MDKRTRVSLLVLSPLFVVSTALVLILWPVANRLPTSQTVSLRFPSMVVADAAQQAYTIDSGTRRIVASNAEGQFRWALEGGKRNLGFYYAYGIALDAEGLIYLYNWLPKSGEDGGLEAIQIQRYSQDGVWQSDIISLVPPEDDPDFASFFSFFIQGDRLYYYLTSNDRLELWRCNLDGGNQSNLLSVEVPFDFVSIYGTQPGSIVLCAKDGSVRLLTEDLSWKTLSLPELFKPWDAKLTADGQLLVLDIVKQEIYKVDNWQGQATLKPLLGAKAAGIATLADSMFVSEEGAISIPDKQKGALVQIGADGNVTIQEQLVFSPTEVFVNWLFWISLVFAVLSLIILLLIIYIKVARFRVPLLLRQLVLFVPIIVSTQIVAFNQVYQGLYARYADEVERTLRLAADLSSKILPGESASGLLRPADFGSQAYLDLDASASQILATLGSQGGVSYISLYAYRDGATWILYTASGSFGIMYPYDVLPPQVRSSFDEGEITYGSYEDEWGSYQAAFAPIRDAKNTIVAVVEAGFFSDLMKDIENKFLAQVSSFALINGLIFVVLFVVLTNWLIHSINPLRKITRDIAAGNMDIQTTLSRRDEIGLLSKDFVTMAGRLKSFINDITRLTEASSRFVPNQFISLLGVEDLTRLKLGDQIARNMSVVFSSLSNYQKLSKSLSAKGAFRFLNAYYGRMVPIIQEGNGVIDKYIGETSMALFPSSVLDALTAVRKLRLANARFNEKRLESGSEGFVQTFGLHWGPLMMGIVGEQERLEGTVISDAVNLTSRLNGLCRIYGVGFVATHSTLLQAAKELGAEGLPVLMQHHPHRLLDYVMVKGKTEALMICEVFSPDVEIPQGVLKLWESAFESWLAGRLEQAKEGFEAYLQSYPDDAPAQRFVSRIQEILAKGQPSPWDPSWRLQEK